MDEMVSRQYLLSEYDRLHEGPPGRAREIIEKAPAVNRWIPTSEQKPEYPCIAYDGHNSPFVPRGLVQVGDDVVDDHVFDVLGISPFSGLPRKGARRKTLEKEFQIVKNIAHCNRIIAWMPLPDPYKEEVEA